MLCRFWLVFPVFFLCSVISVWASEGKLLILPKAAERPLRENKPLFYVGPQREQIDEQTEIPAEVTDAAEPRLIAPQNIPLPTVVDTAIVDAAQHYRSADQCAIVAWNGSEEILLWSSSVKSNVDTAAVVSILPLTGKPVSLERGDVKSLSALPNTISKKIGIEPTVEFQSYWTATKGFTEPHSIAIYEASSAEELEDAINSFLTNAYSDKNVSVSINVRDQKTLSAYFDSGFRYFVIDLSEQRKYCVKTPIQVKFESDILYYPTVIGASGGTGNTRIRLAVFTSGDIKTFGGLKPGDGTGDYEIYVPGKGTQKSVSVSSEELRGLDPSIQNLFGVQGAKGRFFIITGDLDKFEKDVIAWDTVPQSNEKVQEQTNISNEKISDTGLDAENVDDIHLLFVLGTYEEKVRPVIEESKRRLVQLLETTGVFPNVKNFDVSLKRVKAKSVMFLEGDKATPENILGQCRKLDKQTGKDGAIFVYFLCRDTETENGQMLYPLAKSSTEFGEGISQKDIRDAISNHEHRLCVLITDGCQSDNIQRNHEEASSTSTDPIYMFSALLLHGKGRYNIRSASPEKNEIPLGTPEIGCFFTNAFVNNMDTPIEDTGEFDMNERILKWVQSDLNIFCEDATFSENNPVRQTIKMW